MRSVYSNTISTHSIRDKYARNLLRGIMNEEESYKIQNSLAKIKNKCSLLVYKQSLAIIRNNQLFKSNIFIRDFNKVCPIALNDLVVFSSEEVVERINLNQEKLQHLMDLFIKSLKEIKVKDYSHAIETCENIIDEQGVSCFLIRLIYFIKANIEDREKYKELEDKIDKIFNKIQISNIGYMHTAIRELSNRRTDYFNITNKIQSTSSQDPILYISKSFISHVTRSESDFLNTLSSYHLFSLIDSYIYYQNTLRLGLPFLDNTICDELVAKYNKMAEIDITPNIDFLEGEDSMSISFFRCCFLLIEINNFYKYKTTQGALYNKNESKQVNRLPLEKKLINNYFKKVKSLNDLREDTITLCRVNINKYKPNHCNDLENSNALNYLLEKNDADILEQEEIFVKLMSTTLDIGLTCPTYYLEKISKNAISNNLKLVISCLVSIKDKTNRSEHRLRKTIQEIAISEFDADLTKLIEALQRTSPSVTQHLVDICDETFLSKCFKLVSVPNDAIEKRAEMLQWYGNQVDEPKYIDKAKNLRIDVQINKEKEAIDDHRIYVDPIKFSEWISDNILDDITLLFDMSKTEQDTNLSNINWDNAHNGLFINEQIAALLLRCYEEFCNNSHFGIASYLGRRIRHGTFKGTALEEVRDLRKDARFGNIFKNQDFEEYYNRWIDSYEGMLDDLTNSFLHINEKKKPKGMISSNLNTKKKRDIAGKVFLDLMINSYLDNNSNREIPYLVIESCWVCIEEDLSNIRRYLMECKSKFAVFNYNTGKPERNRFSNDTFSIFSQEINTVSAGKFRTISSWFNKPSIASPSANLSLLFKAVLSEIKSYFKDYKPKIISDNSTLTISGGVYFIIYDALYILMYNSAKYGNKSGELELKIKMFDEIKKMNITIVSEPSLDDRNCIKAKQSILKTLNEDFSNANFIEGRSGIKKLNKMAADCLISDINYTFLNNKVSASFNFNLDY